MESSFEGSYWKGVHLGEANLRKFFLSHLDKLYAAKLNLLSKMGLIGAKARFSELKDAISETSSSIEKQLARIQMIYTLLDAESRDVGINGITGLINDAFKEVEQEESEGALQDLAIIFYLQNIESIEMASFQILQMASIKLDNVAVDNLLKENYREAKADRTLLLLISSKYMLR